MSIADNPRHRDRWLADVARITREIQDLQTELDIAVRRSVSRAVSLRIGEADVHLEMAIKELDTAAGRIRTL